MGRKRVELHPIRGERLKFILEREKVKQVDLQEKIGISQQNVSEIIHGKINLTDYNAKLIINLFPESRYRFQWLMGYDDIMTEYDENNNKLDDIRNLIHGISDVAEATRQVIVFAADDICRRENILRENIPIQDFYQLQTQLHDYAELIVSDYLKNRENSRYWKRIDSKTKEGRK